MYLSLFIGYSKTDAGIKVTEASITNLHYTITLIQNVPN